MGMGMGRSGFVGCVKLHICDSDLEVRTDSLLLAARLLQHSLFQDESIGKLVLKSSMLSCAVMRFLTLAIDSTRFEDVLTSITRRQEKLMTIELIVVWLESQLLHSVACST